MLSVAACFGLTVVSAVVPWVHAEIILLSFTTTASSPAAIAAFVIVATAGQMTGKTFLYAAGRQGSRVNSPRIARLLERWRPRWMANPGKADQLVLVSSAVGFPPFIMTALVAGALEMQLARFVVVGTIGRLLHFAGVAFLGDLVTRVL